MMNKNVRIAKQLVMLAKSLLAAKSDETELPDNLSANELYETYIQSNHVFSGMPDECWEFVEKNAKKIYDEALSFTAMNGRSRKWQSAGF